MFYILLSWVSKNLILKGCWEPFKRAFFWGSTRPVLYSVQPRSTHLGSLQHGAGHIMAACLGFVFICGTGCPLIAFSFKGIVCFFSWCGCGYWILQPCVRLAQCTISLFCLAGSARLLFSLHLFSLLVIFVI